MRNGLFDCIAGGRPEHIAKGALVYLLRNSPEARGVLAERLGLRTAEVQRVVPEVSGHWRADIGVFWVGRRRTFLELKLGAPFTKLQRTVMRHMVVVAPRGSSAWWRARAKAVIELDALLIPVDVRRNPALIAARHLLEEACDAYGWCRETIARDTIVREAQAMFETPQSQPRDWPETYRFLNQLDIHLRNAADAGGVRYASDNRMRPAAKAGYYGFGFSLMGYGSARKRRSFWIGFEQVRAAPLGFRLYQDDVLVREFLRGRTSLLRASDVAASAIAYAISPT